jgi:hypothetical protein
MLGTMWTGLKLVVPSVLMTLHFSCKSRLEVPMNLPLRFIGVVTAANSGTTSSRDISVYI